MLGQGRPSSRVHPSKLLCAITSWHAQWTHLARSYEFAESLERFLLDSQRAKDALRPQPPGK
jgi:hypothetical protein